MRELFFQQVFALCLLPEDIISRSTNEERKNKKKAGEEKGSRRKRERAFILIEMYVFSCEKKAMKKTREVDKEKKRDREQERNREKPSDGKHIECSHIVVVTVWLNISVQACLSSDLNNCVADVVYSCDCQVGIALSLASCSCVCVDWVSLSLCRFVLSTPSEIDERVTCHSFSSFIHSLCLINRTSKRRTSIQRRFPCLIGNIL